MKKMIEISKKFGKFLLVFIFSFSQLTFPIGVLADEIVENLENSDVRENNDESTISDDEEESVDGEISSEENTKEDDTTVKEDDSTTDNMDSDSKDETIDSSKYKIFINGEEKTTYTLTDTDLKEVTISQVYDGEEGSYTFDNDVSTISFDNKLYGSYQYIYSVSNEDGVIASILVTINYEGDNSKILKAKETLVYDNLKYYIKGSSKEITVEDVLSNFEIDSLANDYKASLLVKDAEGNVLSDSDTIRSGYQLYLSNGEVYSEYTIIIDGDSNNDGIVDFADACFIVDSILSGKLNEDNEEFTIMDATKFDFTTGVANDKVSTSDKLTNSLVTGNEFYVGESFQVKYYLNGFSLDKLFGIEGNINYDKDILQLVSIDVDSLYGNFNDNGEFVYLLDNYQSNGLFMTITFKGISQGTSTISIENVVLSNGKSISLEDNFVTTDVSILKAGKGGDEAVVIPNKEEPRPVVNIVNEVKDVTSSSTTVQTVSLSSDNLIKSLTIKNYTIDFDENTLEYTIKVGSSVKSLDLEVVLNSSSASYEVEGNSNFKSGENTVNIVVTAEDGSTRTYTIKVTKAKSSISTKEEEVTEKKSTSKMIIIILIILVIIGLIYVIFKDDEEDKKAQEK